MSSCNETLAVGLSPIALAAAGGSLTLVAEMASTGSPLPMPIEAASEPTSMPGMPKAGVHGPPSWPVRVMPSVKVGAGRLNEATSETFTSVAAAPFISDGMCSAASAETDTWEATPRCSSKVRSVRSSRVSELAGSRCSAGANVRTAFRSNPSVPSEAVASTVSTVIPILESAVFTLDGTWNETAAVTPATRSTVPGVPGNSVVSARPLTGAVAT